jgi:hypothetical protein
LAIVATLTACSGLTTHNISDTTNNGKFIKKEHVYNKAQFNSPDKVGNFTRVSETNDLILYTDLGTGEFFVTDKSNNIAWYSNPPTRESDAVAMGINKRLLSSQLILNIGSDKKIDNIKDSVEQGGMQCKYIDNGILIVYRFPDQGLMVPVQYILNEDCFEAQILFSKMKSYNRVTFTNNDGKKALIDYNIYSIDFLPFFGAGHKSEDGYIFVPDGSGSLINFNNGKFNYADYEMPVYNKLLLVPAPNYNEKIEKPDANYEVKAAMPVFGISKKDKAYLAVINGNEGTAIINARVSGKTNEYNNVYCSFKLRREDSELRLSGVSYIASSVKQKANLSSATQDIGEIRYYFLSGENADYSGMANKYRQYLIKEKGLKKKINDNDYPLFLNLYGGVSREKSILGVPTKVFEPLTTFKQAKLITDELSSDGVKSIVVKYSAWNNFKDLGALSTKASPDNAIGGSEDFKYLLKETSKKEIKIFPETDFINFNKNRNGYTKTSNSAKEIDQIPIVQKQSFNKFPVILKEWNLISPLYLDDLVQKFVRSYYKFDNSSLAINNIGSAIYTDYSSGRFIGSGEMPQLLANTLSKTKESISNIMIDGASSYSFPYVDYIINSPAQNSGFDITDEKVPFYQQVLHGYIYLASSPVNLSDEPGKSVLQSIETGGSLHYALVYESPTLLIDTYLDYLISPSFSQWKKSIIENYNMISKDLKTVATATIEKHIKLANGVYETQYDNGISVIVNYNNTDYSENGVIVKANNYLYKGR